MSVVLPDACRPFLLAAAVALLSACGAGEEEAAPTYVGTLTDSAIQGIAYSASPSGLAGTTDADGHFNFKVGDTITFRLGSLVLGAVRVRGAESTITPLDLVGSLAIPDATQEANAVTNLLVLLQSIDEDGTPGNGITVPAAVGAALDSVDAIALQAALTQAPATFAGTSTQLTELSTAAGPNAVVQDPAAALAHFRSEFLANLAGVFALDTSEGPLVFRFTADGSYLMSQVGSNDGVGTAGVERGQIDWNPQTGEVGLVSDPSVDTNGDWGLNALGSANDKVYFALVGNTLVITNSSAPATPQYFTRLGMPAGSLFGPRVLNGNGLDATHFVFLSDFRFVVIDPSPASTTACAAPVPGVEYGNYSVSNTFSPDVFFLAYSNAVYDTNGCGGVHDGSLPSGSAYANTAITLNEDDDSINLEASGGVLYRHTTILR